MSFKAKSRYSSPSFFTRMPCTCCARSRRARSVRALGAAFPDAPARGRDRDTLNDRSHRYDKEEIGKSDTDTERFTHAEEAANEQGIDGRTCQYPKANATKMSTVVKLSLIHI